VVTAGAVAAAKSGTAAATDCARELARIDSMLASLPAPGQAGADADCQIAHLWVQRPRISGVPADLRTAELMVDAALRRHSDWPDLCFLRASLDLDLHCPGRVRNHLASAPDLLESSAAIELLAAADTQLGRYAAAEQRYLSIIATDPSWQALAGLAQLYALRGNKTSADIYFVAAEEEVTAKQMRVFSWLRIQRGDLAADTGDLNIARAHYDTADKAYSGYWLVESRVAKLLHRQGRNDDAVGAYNAVYTRVRRPELAQQLGDVHHHRGDIDTARHWYQKALTAYLESAARNEGLYLHHLARYHATVTRNDAAAAYWAARDHTFRHDTGSP
jgi:tetratricopeptide (TPR) repeat protein